MRNYAKKTTAFILSLIFLLSSTLSVSAAEAEPNINNFNNLVSVVVSDTDSQLIVAQVPSDKVHEYQEDLKNPDFRQRQIDQFSASATRSLPAGEIIAQRYLYKWGIQNAVDRYSGVGTFTKLMSNPITDVLVGAVIKAAGFSNPISFFAGLLTWGAADLLNRQESWWKDSLLLILQNRISCVRVTHIRNTTSSYPAAYLIIERL